VTGKERVVVLGGGIGGLSAGYFLAKTGKYQVTVLEKAEVIGGLSGSFPYDDFTLDYGAHKLYSVIPGILDEFLELMGDRLLEVPKQNRLYLRGHLVDYPLKLGNLARVLGLGMFVRIGFGYALEILRGLIDRGEARSYEEYMLRRFGRPAYELVFEPLADKVWGDPAGLHPEMARTRVPASGGMEVILKLLGLKKETAETSAEFFYYPRKGFGDLPEAMREYIEASGGRVLVGVDVRALQQEGGKVVAVEGLVDGRAETFPTDTLVSSIPLPMLGRLVFGEDDQDFKRAVAGLQFRHLVLVYVFAKRSLALEDQWIFFPERDYIFSRIFEQKQMNPELGPPDRTAICADFTCDEESWSWGASDEVLAQKTIEGLVKGGFIKPEEVTGHLVLRRRNFYPRYDMAYVEKMKAVSRKLQIVENLLLTGRIGMYNYNNSDHCADMGRFIAQNLAQGRAPIDVWNDLEQRVADYVIVD
jgi:protoporphyrinogen oxidase